MGKNNNNNSCPLITQPGFFCLVGWLFFVVVLSVVDELHFRMMVLNQPLLITGVIRVGFIQHVQTHLGVLSLRWLSSPSARSASLTTWTEFTSSERLRSQLHSGMPTSYASTRVSLTRCIQLYDWQDTDQAEL